ncbi:MAG: DUF3147 family protein [Rhizomicrobium sp.]|jgi:hypothetical protein
MNPVLLTVFKVAITAAVIVALSELAKRWTLVATIAPSIPIGSGMIAVLLYIDTHDSTRAGNYAWNVFLLTPPGSVFLIAMPLCLRAGLAFWPSVGIGVALTVIAYYAYTMMLQRVFGVTL